MRILVATVVSVFLVTFAATPSMGAGWFWDTGSAFGFAAFAGLLYLSITSNPRLEVSAHQRLGYAVLALAIGHAFWFMLGDAVAVQYLRPGAPAYMWLGAASLLLLAALVLIALVPDRLRWHANHQTFRIWHRVLGIATIASASYHIVVSGFYLSAGYQAAIFTAIAAVAAFGRPLWVRLGPRPVASTTAFLLVAAFAGALFAAVRNFSL